MAAKIAVQPCPPSTGLASLSSHGYDWIRELGRGQYGVAHHVRKAPHGDDAVAKIVFLDHLKDRDRDLSHQEVLLLGWLQHPNIVQQFESWLHSSGAEDGQEALVNIMEFCSGGDLCVWLRERSKTQDFVTEAVVLGLFAQMVSGLNYIHGLKILHRDLKTSNMFLNASHDVVKIGDFGIARVLDSTSAVAVTSLGTPYYMSPEICNREPYRDKSDIWSMGCVLYELCMFHHAFKSKSLLGLVYQICSGHYDPIADRYSKELAALVDSLFAKAVEDRPTAEQILGADILQPHRPCESKPGSQQLDSVEVEFTAHSQTPQPRPRTSLGPAAMTRPMSQQCLKPVRPPAKSQLARSRTLAKPFAEAMLPLQPSLTRPAPPLSPAAGGPLPPLPPLPDPPSWSFAPRSGVGRQSPSAHLARRKHAGRAGSVRFLG